MKQKTLRIISMMLCLIMLVGMIPAAVSAAEAGSGTEVTKYTVTTLEGAFLSNGQTTGSFAPGDKVTILAKTTELCKVLYGWSVKGISAPDKETQFTFTMPAGNVTIAAQFITEHDTDKNGVCKVCKNGYYQVTAGKDAQWKKGSADELSFTSNGKLNDLVALYVDEDKLIEDTHYTASGNTVAKLPYSFLNGLKEGKHTVTFKFKDGSCSAGFTIQAAPALTTKVVKSIVMEVTESKPAAGKSLYYPVLVSVNGRTDHDACALLDSTEFKWYFSETYSTNSSAYQEYENADGKFVGGYAYNLYTYLEAAAGASFAEKCTFTLKTPSGTISGHRYETREDDTSFDVFFDVIPDPSAPTTTTTTTTTATKAPASDGITVKRLSGSNRYSTAIDICGEGWNKADTVVIASGENYPDALAGTVLAKSQNAPILLVKKSVLEADVLAELQRLGAKKIIILGGEAAVAKTVADNLAKTFTVTRVGGSNRNDTAARIALKVTDKSKTVFLVSNKTYADALSAGSAAALSEAPILYVNADGTIPAETAAAMKSLGCSKAYVVGGEAAVAKKIESELKAIDVSFERLSGSNRYETAIAVFKEFKKLFTSDSVAVATGKAFPDALAGVALAAGKGMPVFLVGDKAPVDLVLQIATLDIDALYVFGGINAVPQSVVTDLVR